ncbi:MAG: cytidine deaminase [Planctomycetota bacterium]
MRRGRRTRISPSEPRVPRPARGKRADQDLIAHAREVQARSYSPYSGLRVGAAARDVEGRIFTGCNVENASFGLTLCAERAAVFKAVSEGASPLVSMAITTSRGTPVMPCGACRQVLAELAPRLELIAAGKGGRSRRAFIRDLLPNAFGPADLS